MNTVACERVEFEMSVAQAEGGLEQATTKRGLERGGAEVTNLGHLDRVGTGATLQWVM